MKNKLRALGSHISLKDGRLLGFSEFGDPKGHPVFYFHGFPGSRLQASDFHEVAKTHHYRFFGIDRPGMGVSTFNKKHSILSWSQDISALANCLKIDRFSIIGHSGGAPFVMACAYAIPERLIGAAIVSGMAPTTLPESKVGMARGLQIINALVRNIPGFAFLLMKIQQKMMLKPKVFNQFVQKLPMPDRIILQDSNRINAMIDALAGAFNQGARGPAQEMQLILQPWGFDLKKITYPITIWQGKLDMQVPVSHAEVYKTRLPHARLKLFENEAHLSTLYNHMEDILESVNPKRA
ncbi:MAG: alpha/beta hydrolase [Legionella longbeachae]|nr:alpha/beta hydrolase [Legionella longbeachae]